MNNNTKHIIKLIALVICIFLLVWICYLLVSLNNITNEQINTPIKLNLPKIEKIKPFKPIKKEVTSPENTQEKNLKPLTRDENDVPKSDVNVPEIG